MPGALYILVPDGPFAMLVVTYSSWLCQNRANTLVHLHPTPISRAAQCRVVLIPAAATPLRVTGPNI